MTDHKEAMIRQTRAQNEVQHMNETYEYRVQYWYDGEHRVGEALVRARTPHLAKVEVRAAHPGAYVATPERKEHGQWVSAYKPHSLEVPAPITRRARQVRLEL